MRVRVAGHFGGERAVFGIRVEDELILLERIAKLAGRGERQDVTAAQRSDSRSLVLRRQAGGLKSFQLGCVEADETLRVVLVGLGGRIFGEQIAVVRIFRE
jgi:hypothetical protein